MYRQFCRNLNNYLNINKSNSYRYKIGKEIELLTDVQLYSKLKKSSHIDYKKISNLIYQMRKYENENLVIKNFVWELWGYGFEVEKLTDIENEIQEDEEDIREKIKLIHLLLGTHYWN